MLYRNSIDVWRIRIDTIAGLHPFKLAKQIEAWYGILSLNEQEKADRFLAEEHRADYIAAHASLRYVLGMYLNAEPSSIPIVASEAGKPVLATAQASNCLAADPDLRFNLSHTRGAVLIGIVIGRELGVDIEWKRPMEDLEEMARSVMSDAELTLWKRLEGEERTRVFYEIWTRKEAYLKAIGLGLYRNLHDVTVPVSTAGEIPGTPKLILDDSGQGSWMISGLSTWEGYSAAVCWEGGQALPVEVKSLEILECDLAGIGNSD